MDGRSWYILPMLPGTAMMLIAIAFIPTLGPFVALFYAAAFTAAFILTGVANKRGARRLQQKIAELRGQAPITSSGPANVRELP